MTPLRKRRSTDHLGQVPFMGLSIPREALLDNRWEDYSVRCSICGEMHTWSLIDGQLIVDGQHVELAEGLA